MIEVLAKLNFNELCGLAISHLYMSVEAFYDLTPIEFKYALKNIQEREADQFKTKYEVARYIAYNIWNSAGKSLKGVGLREAREVGLFGWEVDEELSKQQSVEDMKQSLLGIAKRSGKIKDKRKGQK